MGVSVMTFAELVRNATLAQAWRAEGEHAAFLEAHMRAAAARQQFADHYVVNQDDRVGRIDA